jgi:2-desacetyl-2-hydroxyethyl bacteriochlorophyllide A dehydrogenase
MTDVPTNTPASAARLSAGAARGGRAAGQFVMARALWYVKPDQAELRTERLGPPSPGNLRIATEYSAISRGTERLVAAGLVPESEWSRMRAPFQAGQFPFPVKYGYSAAGRVIAGDEAWLGRRVFCLHPHQDVFQVPHTAVVACDGIPARRATLAANMETALNAHWDAATLPGDKVAVVGGGIVGLLVAYLARRIPGVAVTLIDVAPDRAELAAALGIPFGTPDTVTDDHTAVFHTSATSRGLQTAIAAAAFEARIVELSWYGNHAVSVQLGGAFHSRRLKLLSSQVGHVAPRQRATTTHRQRLEQAVALLDDDTLDILIQDDIAFAEVPSALGRLWANPTSGLPPVIRY